MTHKIKMTVEVTIEGRSALDVGTFIHEGLEADLINGGPFVVTAKGTEDCGIVSARVVGLEELEK